MSSYQTILVAIDLSEDAKAVAAKAKAVSAGNEASLHLVHVIEPLSFAYGGDIPMDFSDIQDEIEKQARELITRLASQLEIPDAHTHVLLGRPEAEIHNLAESLSADLIVVGSHGRHGLALLLGSTANGVLHGASCDVLAVRVN